MKSWLKEHAQKVIPRKDIATRVEQFKSEGYTIATLNGSFDLLHAGHLQIIFEASQMADLLIVALNSDESIRKYKSIDRPIIPLNYRIQMMAALEFVDFVTWFEETDPRDILRDINPNIHVNGAEYGHQCIEADIVKSAGGQIHIVELVPGLSTTYIIKKIQKLC